MIGAAARRERRRRFWRRCAWIALLVCSIDLVVTWLFLDPPKARLLLIATGIRTAGSVALILVSVGELLFGAWWARRPGRRQKQEARLTLPALGALGIMVMLFVGGLIGRRNGMLLAAAMISGPFVVNGWLAHVMLRGISLRRRLVDRASVGEPVWVELELTNRKRWFAVWLTTLNDEIVSEGESLETEVVVTRTAPRSESRGRYRFQPMRRGRYVFGPVVVRTSFPLGFVERSQLFEESSELVVRPRIGRLTSVWRRSRQRNEARVRILSVREGGVEDEFQKLREFRPGDPTRKVHWRTSARRDELMIRDDRQAHAPPYTLLVDLWQPESPGDADLDRVELAVSFVATLCVDQLTRNRDSELRVGIAGAEAKSWVGRSGPAGIEALLDELAIVRPGTTTDLPKVAEEVHTSAGPRTAIVLVTTRPPEEVDRLLGDLEPDTRRRLAEARVVEADPETLGTLITFPEETRR